MTVDALEKIDRVTVTPAAAMWITKLIKLNGLLLFHQSGGCCDGSAPMCYTRYDFKIGDQDVLLGYVTEQTPFYMSEFQFEYWRHTQLIIDVVSGRGSGFSLEAPLGIRFLTRSRMFSSAEIARLSTF